jgi:hypothetical protein
MWEAGKRGGEGSRPRYPLFSEPNAFGRRGIKYARRSGTSWRRARTRALPTLRATLLFAIHFLRPLSSGVFTKPGFLLRLEGGLDLALSLIFYQAIHAD